MLARAVVCTRCRKVIAIGAGLPALCLAEVPTEERAGVSRAALESNPRAHRDCIELEVVTADGLEPEALLEDVRQRYAEQIDVMSELLEHIKPES